MYKKYSRKNKNLPLLILLLVLFFIGGVVLTYAVLTKDNESETTTNTINFGPPTENEKAAGNEQKKEIVENEKEETIPNTAEVVIVDANQYDNEIEVRAFVSNVVKDGVCTYVFENNDQKIEKTSPAKADASTTPCITLLVPRSEFPTAGTWNLTITYSNEEIMGSTSSTIEIQ